jgi:hypothetical protein
MRDECCAGGGDFSVSEDAGQVGGEGGDREGGESRGRGEALPFEVEAVKGVRLGEGDGEGGDEGVEVFRGGAEAVDEYDGRG